jgi:hypothetical protein
MSWPPGDPIDPSAAAQLLGGSGAFSRHLDELLAEAAHEQAVEAREHRRWLRQAAAEEATFAGTLVDLAEAAAVVVVAVAAAGRRVRGRITGVGADFVALATDQGQDALLPFRAVGSVRAEPGHPAVIGDRGPALALLLAELLPELAAERTPVAITTDHEVVAGVLAGAGADVLTVRAADSSPACPVYVPLSAVRLVLLP